jgi:DNA-3-methyladenine glycosylase II
VQAVTYFAGPMSIVNQHDVEFLTGQHPLFAQIMQQYGPPPNWSRPAGFVSLCKIILEQQVSLASAHAHFQKLHQYVKIFSPEQLLLLSDEEMRACQISKQKSTYLRALSTAILQQQLDLDALHTLDEDSIRTQLTRIKGIGQWTSDIYLLFCLQAKDIFPIGDIAVVNTIRELTDAHSKEAIAQLAEQWKPYRSLATYFLWHYYLKKRNRTAP